MFDYIRKCSLGILGLLCLACIGQGQTTPPDPLPAPGGSPLIFYGAATPSGGLGPVVVFVPGLGSCASYWWTNGNNMYEMVWAADYRTAFINFIEDNNSVCDNNKTIANNAVLFQQLLPEITSYYNVDQVYVVALSKGGLDVQYAMLDTPTRQKIKALFTLATPNQGDALADWAYKPGGVGAAILQAICNANPGFFCPLSDGLKDLQTSNVQATIRTPLDPILTNAGIPIFTLAGNTPQGNPLLLATGIILNQLTGEANDGLVTVPETLLTHVVGDLATDQSYAFNMGLVKSNHFMMGDGNKSFAFIRGRIDGFEFVNSTLFKKAATGGFGDTFNTWAWSMRWFKGKLYVGTGRVVNCVILATNDVQTGTHLYPPADINCTPDMKDLPMRAEIWRYTPETKVWERVYQSPQDIPIGTNAEGFPAFAAREIGIRDLFVFTEADATQALYAGGVSAISMFGVLPEWAPDNYPPPRILRTTDGVNWQPVPQAPGTFMGDLVKNYTDITATAYRSFQAYKGMLFANVTNLRGEGYLIASANPFAGNDAWQRVSAYPAKTAFPVWDLQVFNGFLYVSTGDKDGPGYSVYKTDATALDPTPCPVPDCQPYVYTQIVPFGGDQTLDKLRSPIGLTLAVFDNMLYVGTDRKTEMVRIHPDDSWELVVGEPRVSPSAQYIAPISGIGQFFDNVFNQHFWQMSDAYDGLHMGTWDFSVQLRYSEALGKLFSFEMGFDLMKTADGIHWHTLSITGMGDGVNFGGRSMARTPFGLFVGTARPDGGTQVWLDQGVLDYNNDGIIDRNDVNVIMGIVGQPASGPNDPHDLDQDGKITVLDARKLLTQCTLPGCASLPAATLQKLAPKIAPPAMLHAESELTAGTNVSLDWLASPGAVRYRVYRQTVHSITDFIIGGLTVTVPGTNVTVSLPGDALNGKLDSICAQGLQDTAVCMLGDAIQTSALSNGEIGFPTPAFVVAAVSGTSYQEKAPTEFQSLYFVRAEDADGNLSEPSNIVGAPSKALN